MTANSRFPCAINPDTGKPFTKHKTVSEQIPYAYYRGAYGDSKPLFTHTLRCVRPGCKKNIATRRD